MGKVERDSDFSPAEPAAQLQKSKPESAPEPSDDPAGKGADAEQAKSEPAASDAAPEPTQNKRRTLRLALFALLPIALIVGGYVYVTGGSVMESENAYLRADMVAVSTDVSGIVKSVAVHDNQSVKKGQVLLTLDPLPFKLALEQAQGQLGMAKAQLLALKGSYAQTESQIKQAKVDIDFYQREFDRKQALVKRNFASKADFDAAQHNLQDAQQQLATLKTQLAQAAAKLDDHPDYPVEKLSGYKYALAQRDEAARKLRHTTLRAPFDGVVTNVPSVQVGQYLAAANSAFSLVSGDHMWVEAKPKETQLTYVRPGQKVTVTVDTYPDEEWHGTVQSISPASASSFSLLPAQNTSGNWVKVVQRIPVRIDIDTPKGKPPLRSGMSVEIAIDTGHPRGVPSFLTGWFGADKSQSTAAAAEGDSPAADARSTGKTHG